MATGSGPRRAGATRGVGRNGAVIVGPGGLLELIRRNEAQTRADLAELTGLSRSTVTQRLETLLAHGLIRSGGDALSTGGRRPTNFVFNEHAGIVLAADLGVTHARVGVTDLSGQPLAEHAEPIEIAQGPEPVLDWLAATFDRLIVESGHQPSDVRGVGIGVPGPVEFAVGEPVSPPLMPGWDRYPVPQRFAERYGVPVLVDNDVNIMALGEHWTRWPECEHLLYVKVGTGIGAGIVASRTIHRGAEGAAGDIGHVRVEGHDDVLCHCGNSGCLEAVAGGRAIARRLTELGVPAANSHDVVRLVGEHDPQALALVREAGRLLGDVLSSTVNFFNPRVIVIGGDIARAHYHLLVGVRERIYRRSTPLALRDLVIAESSLDDRAGVIGAAVMVIEQILGAGAVDAALAVPASG
jgi:predicted NBD/HSP70 family sugar kinase